MVSIMALTMPLVTGERLARPMFTTGWSLTDAVDLLGISRILCMF